MAANAQAAAAPDQLSLPALLELEMLRSGKALDLVNDCTDCTSQSLARSLQRTLNRSLTVCFIGVSTHSLRRPLAHSQGQQYRPNHSLRLFILLTVSLAGKNAVRAVVQLMTVSGRPRSTSCSNSSLICFRLVDLALALHAIAACITRGRFIWSECGQSS